MRTAALYLLLLMGVAACTAAAVILGAAYRYRERNTHGNLLHAVALALFFAVTGACWVLAFAAPNARGWAIYTAAFLLLGRGVAFAVAKRVIKRRERTSAG